MDRDESLIISLALIMIAVFGALAVSFFIMEGVENKLERTCQLYDMDYIYRNGDYCVESDGTLRPISSDCPPPHKRGTCDIKFLKYE